MCNKIGLLSLDPHNYNYGGILQEYALQAIIEMNGYKCEVIDNKGGELCTFSPKRNIRYLTLEKLYGKFGQIVSREKSNRQATELVERRKAKFDHFCQCYIKFSATCSHGEFQKFALNYDVIVCGSDQGILLLTDLPCFWILCHPL